MSTVASSELVTPEHLALMDDDKDFELVDGQLVRRHMGNLAAWVAAEVATKLTNHVRGQKLGWVFTSDAGYRLDPNRPLNVRKPDVSFVRFGRIPGEIPSETYESLAPDLAVEVVSPTDTARELEEKIEEYLDSGVRQVWVLYPELSTMRVHRCNGVMQLLRNGDEVSGDDVIPLFRCKLSDLFDLPTPAKLAE